MKWLNAAAGVTVTGLVASLVVFSIVADGATAVTLSAHDDGAWLLDPAFGTAVHVSGAGQQVDSLPVVVGTPQPGVSDGIVLAQHGNVTVALDRNAGLVSVIDPATREVQPAGGQMEVEEGVDVLAAARGVVLLHPDGRLAQLADGTPLPGTATDEIWTDGPGPDLVGATAIDGSAWVYSRTTGALWYLGDDGVRRFAITPMADAQLTVVGLTPVLLGDQGRTVIVGDDTERRLSTSFGPDATLQLPSAETLEVLVADGTDVMALRLDGTANATKRLSDVGDDLVRPAVFAGCAHGFSQASGTWMRACADGPTAQSTLEPGPAELRLVNDRLWLDSLQGGTDFFISNDVDPVEVTELETTVTDEEAEESESDPTSGNDTGSTVGGGVEASFEPAQNPDGASRPNAVADEFGTRGDAVVLPVLLNDTDADLDPLYITEVEGDAGTFQVAIDGQAIAFTPADGFEGETVATYTVTDGQLTANAKVTVSLRGDGDQSPPKTMPDTGRIEAGRQLVIDVLANDHDPDGDALVIDATSLTDDEVDVRLDDTGEHVVFTAPDTAGIHEFTYVVLDALGEAAEEETVSVKVTEPGEDIAPYALPDLVFARAGVPVEVEPLTNDTDPNLDPMDVDVQDDGGLQVAPGDDGVLTVTADESGRIVYRATAEGKSSNASVIQVVVVPAAENRPPVAVRDDTVARAGVPSALNLVDVLANDADPDGDSLTAVLLPNSVDPAISVVGLGRGLFEVTVEDPTKRSASFRYEASDSKGGTAVSSVAVRIVPPPEEPEPPIANDDEDTVRAGEAKTVNVLSNDGDPNGLPFRLDAIAEGPAWATLGANGIVVAPPADAAAATVTIRYVIVNEAGLPDEATLTLTLLAVDAANSAPTPVDDVSTTYWDTPVVIPVLANDTDPENDVLDVVTVGGGTHGRAETVAGGVRYVPFDGLTEPVSDTFTYTVSDGTLEAQAIVTVQLERPPAVNQPPVARDDTAEAVVGRPLTIDVLTNDTDPESGSDITLADNLASGDGFTLRRAGNTVEFTATRAGRLTFGYTISDPIGLTDTATVTVNVTEDAPAPRAFDDATPAPVRPGERVSVDVLLNDQPRDGLVVQFADTTVSVSAGIATLTAPARTTRYPYTVRDAAGRTSSAVLTVVVIENRAPTVVAGAPVAVDVESDVSVPLSGYVTDPDGDPLTFTLAGQPALGQASVSGGTARFTAGAVAGVTSIAVDVSDGTNTVRLTVPVEVRGRVNLPPGLRAATLTFTAGESATINLAPLVTDPENAVAAMRFTATASPPLSARIEGTTLVVTAPADTGDLTTSVQVSVVDGDLAPVPQTFAVTVLRVVRPEPVLVPDGPFSAPIDATSFVTPDLTIGDTLNGGTVTGAQIAGGGPSLSISGGRVTVPAPAAGFGSVSFVYIVNDANGVDRASPVVTVTFRSTPGLVTVREASPGVLDLSTYDARGGTFVGFDIEVDGAAPVRQTGTTFTVPGAPGTQHTVRVRLVTDIGTGAYSPALTVTIPARIQDPPVIRSFVGVDVFLGILLFETLSTNGATITAYEIEINGAFRSSQPARAGQNDAQLSIRDPGRYEIVVISVSDVGRARSAPYVLTFDNLAPTMITGSVFAYNLTSSADGVDRGTSNGLVPSRCCDLSGVTSDLDGTVRLWNCTVAGQTTGCGAISSLGLGEGTYTVTVEFFDDLNGRGTGTFTLHVANIPPVVAGTCTITSVTDNVDPASGAVVGRRFELTVTRTLGWSTIWPVVPRQTNLFSTNVTPDGGGVAVSFYFWNVAAELPSGRVVQGPPPSAPVAGSGLSLSVPLRWEMSVGESCTMERVLAE